MTSSLESLHKISLQELEHICRLADGQILPILLAMDPADLLNCGRASPRLFRLVCDREVWCHLLKGFDFTKEQMEELRLFGRGLFGIRGSPEMMEEVVKEAAKRFSVFHHEGGHEVKMTIAIKSWGAPETFEVDCIYLEELTKVAKAVGGKFTITEIIDLSESVTGGLFGLDNLMAVHIAQQKERVHKLELTKVNLSLPGARDLFYELLFASNQWSVQNLILYKRQDCEALARRSASGSIRTLHLRVNHKLPQARWQNDFKRVWGIADKVVFRLMMSDTPDVEMGGGKGAEDADAEWQRILQVVFAA